MTELKKGQILESGFEILDVRELPELKASGIWARHLKSGAEVFHVKNDDEENLFAFAFATPPCNSTGVAHILEHSVLCGSQSYPLKDAFLVLAQGSLQTFLNAWTFPDKTVYPASSVNEQDYFNLMSVYADAVFRPLLSEWTFMQEGHRLVYESAGDGPGRLKVTGVVYNEMKGAYSSLDAYADLWSVKAVLPGTPYDFESGGDPECIPDLSLEDLRNFHRAWYSPANCRVFLAGNIPTEKQLAFLDREFFSSLPPGTRNAPIKRTARWDAPKAITIPCPAGAEQKPTVLLSWLCGDATDSDETLALAALAEILLGHDGSPLTRALVDSGLGEDLSPVCGMEGELRETAFCTGLRGVGRLSLNHSDSRGESLEEAAKKVERLILGELERLASEGIDKEEIDAALLGMEFSQREIRRSGGPYSLVWMRRSLKAWLHGAAPWDSLLFAPPFAELKRRIGEDQCFFEKMIRRYFLENPHRALIIIEPEEGFLEEKEAALERRLAGREASMGEAGIKALEEKEAELAGFQEKEDSPAALASIPHLSRSDLSPEINFVKKEFADASGTPLLMQPLFTNGISYVDLAFPIDVLPPEDYQWIPFFSRTVVSMGLPGMDYGEVSSLLARTAGGFLATGQTNSLVNGASRAAVFPGGIHDIGGRDWIIYRLKALDEKLDASLDLALRIITEADFSDQKRLKDLSLEMKNDLDSGLTPSGHSFASGRSGRLFSRSRIIDELWSGLDQILFAHKLSCMDTAEIYAKLLSIRTRLAGAGVLVNYAGNSAAEAEKIIGKYFGSFGPPHPKNPDALIEENFAALSEYSKKTEGGRGKAEVFSSPSLQIGFAAISLGAAQYGSPLQAAELVFSHQLSTGALWETIRMKGGAYGAFAQPDSLEGVFSFSTYRDPNPSSSLDAFSSILMEQAEYSSRNVVGDEEVLEKAALDKEALDKEALDKEALDKEALDKAVIGTFARETRPRTPSEKSFAGFLRFLYGIEDWQRTRLLRDIISVNEEQIGLVEKRIASEMGESGKGGPHAVIIAGKNEAEKAALALGVDVLPLPV